MTTTAATRPVQSTAAAPILHLAFELALLALWDGTPLPPGLRARLEREWMKVELLTQQIRLRHDLPY